VQVGVSTVAEPGHSIETANWISGFIQQVHGISSIAHSSVPPHKNPYHGFSGYQQKPDRFYQFFFFSQSLFFT
jgi:hypothetical protein